MNIIILSSSSFSFPSSSPSSSFSSSASFLSSSWGQRKRTYQSTKVQGCTKKSYILLYLACILFKAFKKRSCIAVIKNQAWSACEIANRLRQATMPVTHQMSFEWPKIWNWFIYCQQRNKFCTSNISAVCTIFLARKCWKRSGYPSHSSVVRAFNNRSDGYCWDTQNLGYYVLLPGSE